MSIFITHVHKLRILSYANGKGTDQTAHPHSLISATVIIFWKELYLHFLHETFQIFKLNSEALKGGPSIPYPFNYFKKYSISLKLIWQISPKFRKHCIPISLKLIQVSCIPLNIYKSIQYPFKFLVNIPVSLKSLPGPQLCRLARVLPSQKPQEKIFTWLTLSQLKLPESQLT